jgi:hypothetical protein
VFIGLKKNSFFAAPIDRGLRLDTWPVVSSNASGKLFLMKDANFSDLERDLWN